jgi:iron-sulfur cluster repair protein YtfE (RIC family)
MEHKDMRSLTETANVHRDRLIRHVDRLNALAEIADAGTSYALRAGLEDELRFLEEQLVPHMQAIETTLYERLERLMDGRHSMAPMRQEHEELRRLIETLGGYRTLVASGDLGPVEAMGLRRVLYRTHSILRVHLAEEALYLRVLERNLSSEEKESLARGIDRAAGQRL